MTDKKYPNSGAIFRNTDKSDPKHADYDGSISIEGVGDFYLDGWIREGARGKFLSLRVKPKEQKAAAGGGGTTAKSSAMNDEVPFAAERRG